MGERRGGNIAGHNGLDERGGGESCMQIKLTPLKRYFKRGYSICGNWRATVLQVVHLWSRPSTPMDQIITRADYSYKGAPPCTDKGKGVPSFDEMMDIALVEVDFDDPTTNVRGRRALAIAKPTPRGY